MFKTLIMTSLIFSSLSVFAQDSDHDYITSVEVQKVETPYEEKATIELPKFPNPVDEVIMYIDGIIAIGKKIWPIIDAGRPVINTSGLAPSISIVPEIEGKPLNPQMYQMAEWSAPKAISYKVTYKNFFGAEVISFVYTIYFQFNGSYNGVGKYISGLKVQASHVSAAWGFDFDAQSELVNVSNVGTYQNPVAAAIIQISYKGRGKLNEMRDASSFFVDGKGNINLITR